MGLEGALFYALGAIAVTAALGMVLFVRNVVAGAMSLVVTMIALAAIYVLLEAYLVAAIQVMVYAGAILVLFLFVIMLLNLRSDDFAPLAPSRRLLKLAGVALVGWGLLAFVRALPGHLPAVGAAPEGYGGYRALGLALFTDFVIPVETAALLMLAAIVGAVILAKRRIDG